MACEAAATSLRRGLRAGSKTVLRYLLKPLIAVQENAFCER